MTNHGCSLTKVEGGQYLPVRKNRSDQYEFIPSLSSRSEPAPTERYVEFSQKRHSTQSRTPWIAAIGQRATSATSLAVA